MIGRLTPQLLLIGLGLAILLPVIPFSLEVMAPRRRTAAAFGTLMALEPAIALLVGLVALRQAPTWAAATGVLFVVAAGVGAECTGHRPAVQKSGPSSTGETDPESGDAPAPVPGELVSADPRP